MSVYRQYGQTLWALCDADLNAHQGSVMSILDYVCVTLNGGVNKQ